MNKVSLKSIEIFGIHNPYTIAFNISGSNNDIQWDLIETYDNLGEELYAKSILFSFSGYTNLYRYIKVQSIKSNRDKVESEIGFGMFEIELYGIFIPRNTLTYCTKLPQNKHEINSFIFVMLYKFIMTNLKTVTKYITKFFL